MSRSFHLIVLALVAAACSDGGPVTEPPPPPPDDTTTVNAGETTYLFAAGNVAKCSNSRDEATAALIQGDSGFVVPLGDNAFENGTAANYNDCYAPSWGRFLDRTHPVLGNHEYDLTAGDGAFDYFGDRAGPRGKGYYSAEIGPWHLIVLNDNLIGSNWGPGSEQGQWLAADLQANTKKCTVAVWHQPYYLSSNTAGFTSRYERRSAWSMLYAAGVDVVLNGHQHWYERMAPMNPDGGRDDATGIRQFNVGTGGESLVMPTTEIHPNSEVRGAAYGVLKMTLRADSYDWAFLPMAGETFSDSGSGTCH